MREDRYAKFERLISDGVQVAAAARAAKIPRASARRHLEMRSQLAPYGSKDTSKPAIPPPDYGADQPAAQTVPPEFRGGYHDHTFRASAAPNFFGDFTLQKARAAIEMHDQGLFYESWRLAIAMTRFAPVYAALEIRTAPVISLPRKIAGGQRGLARMVREEITEQLAPQDGLIGSPYFPPYLWGDIEQQIAMMGFCVLQHVHGEPDDRMVRPVFTRVWPGWATVRYAYRKTFVALTTDGPVDILNDGKFTLIGKTSDPHFQGAVRALVGPTLSGVQAMQARDQWIDRFADPKLVATAPEGTAVRSPEGMALFNALATIYGPEGKGVLPFGATLESIGIDAKAAGPFKDALESNNAYISAILTGTDISPGTGGVYKSPMFWGIVRATIGDDIAAIVRGVNGGHVYPYTRMNYAAGIEQDQARGTWVDPVLSIPLPDPEADARIASYILRRKALTDQIQADRQAGAEVGQDQVDGLARSLDVETIVLADKTPTTAEITEKDVELKVVAPDEYRARKGLDPLPDGVGTVEQLARERAEGKDKAGTKPADADLTTADAQETTAKQATEDPTPEAAPVPPV